MDTGWTPHTGDNVPDRQDERRLNAAGIRERFEAWANRERDYEHDDSIDDIVADAAEALEAAERERDALAEALREYGAKPGGLLRLIQRRESAERVNGQLREALERRIESDDSMEGGYCECSWCAEDRALLASLTEQEPA